MEQYGWGWQVLGQLYDAGGFKIGNEFRVDAGHDIENLFPVVVPLLNGGFVIVWQVSGSRNAIVGSLFKPTVQQLQPFLLLAPSNDATLTSSQVQFCWQQPGSIRERYPWEIIFDLHIDTDSNFPHPQIINNIQDTTYTIDSLAAGKTYFWKVLAKNLAGDSLWSKQQDWGFFIKPGATSVETGEQNLPKDFTLFQNYPNPFNSSTSIKYQLTAATDVKLEIYILRGQRFRVLVDQFQRPGVYSIEWDGTDEFNQIVASGIYLCQLKIKNLSQTNRLILLR